MIRLVVKYDKNLVKVNKFHLWTFNCDSHKYNFFLKSVFCKHFNSYQTGNYCISTFVK